MLREIFNIICSYIVPLFFCFVFYCIFMGFQLSTHRKINRDTLEISLLSLTGGTLVLFEKLNIAFFVDAILIIIVFIFFSKPE